MQAGRGQGHLCPPSALARAGQAGGQVRLEQARSSSKRTHLERGPPLAHDAISLSAIGERLHTAEQRSAPIIAERNRALANHEFLSNFEKLNLYPSQLTVFARVAEKLPANGSRITVWSYQDGDLQFTVVSPVAPDILFYVKTYSSVEGFTDVTADRADSDRGLRIKLRLAKR